MTKGLVIKLPNGTVIEASTSMSPEQITAIVNAVSGNTQVSNQEITHDKGREMIKELTLEEIWNTSNKEKVALFLRNYFASNTWFNAKQVRDQQIAEIGAIIFGESSQIGTYLTRLYETGYLDKRKGVGRTVEFMMTPKLTSDYPAFSTNELDQLLSLSL